MAKLIEKKQSESSLIFNIAQISFEEILSTNGIITDHNWFTDGTKTTKVKEISLTNTNSIITQEVHKQYDRTGILLVNETLTRNITVTNGIIVSSTNTLV